MSEDATTRRAEDALCVHCGQRLGGHSAEGDLCPGSTRFAWSGEHSDGQEETP